MHSDKGVYLDIPVQNTKELVWQKIQEIPISECGEPLVSVGNTGRIRALPVYFSQGIKGAIKTILCVEVLLISWFRLPLYYRKRMAWKFSMAGALSQCKGHCEKI